MNLAKVVIIEGPDRSGKQTQTENLTSRLKAQGHKVKLIEVPIKSSIFTYRLIYWMLNNGMAKKFPNFFQTVQFINRLMFQITRLPFILLFYDYVIFDRWSLSSIVYGSATGANVWMCKIFAKLLIGYDRMIILNGKTYNVGRETDDYENDDLLQISVKQMYSKWASEHNLSGQYADLNVLEIDNRLQIDEITDMIMRHIKYG